MAMGPERSKTLHNFSLPFLKWGHQRLLPCVKDAAAADHQQPPHPLPPPQKRKAIATDDDIDAVRQKLMVDLRVAADKLKVSIFEDGAAVAGANSNPRPWNLRTRRAACKAPEQNQQHKNLEAMAGGAKDDNHNHKSMVEQKKTIHSDETPKFSVSLSKAEVDQDYWALLGTRPPRRPKKRPRIVQRQLDSLFPGLWLTEVTAESYKVPDVPE